MCFVKWQPQGACGTMFSLFYFYCFTYNHETNTFKVDSALEFKLAQENMP
jgi:hypothetical protein